MAIAMKTAMILNIRTKIKIINFSCDCRYFDFGILRCRNIQSAFVTNNCREAVFLI